MVGRRVGVGRVEGLFLVCLAGVYRVLVTSICPIASASLQYLHRALLMRT